MNNLDEKVRMAEREILDFIKLRNNLHFGSVYVVEKFSESYGRDNCVCAFNNLLKKNKIAEREKKVRMGNGEVIKYSVLIARYDSIFERAGYLFRHLAETIARFN